eukprot:CAMPEP_0170616400 /NCGR_PEP_ID=MMETSP0224-20130122/25850_1 /TAXON_ID=285029 /ORGANISM="Togula jolla, Strain CCCM 725" /LENGTH=87 /DNA_ID=CAMNT_0010942195 /DNA_START=656 /DNA_END=919 /DNA_ORIENTATION=+
MSKELSGNGSSIASACSTFMFGSSFAVCMAMATMSAEVSVAVTVAQLYFAAMVRPGSPIPAATSSTSAWEGPCLPTSFTIIGHGPLG